MPNATLLDEKWYAMEHDVAEQNDEVCARAEALFEGLVCTDES